MKITEELVKKWKKNRIQNVLLTDEEWSELILFETKDLQWFNAAGQWRQEMDCLGRKQWHTYRLRPDYQLPKEPKIVKCEVDVSGEIKDMLVITIGNVSYNITTVPSFKNFSHFEYPDGSHSTNPRIPNAKNKVALTPKYVVFIED